MKKIIVIASLGLLLCGSFFLPHNEKEAKARYCGFAHDHVCCTFGFECYCLDPEIDPTI